MKPILIALLAGGGAGLAGGLATRALSPTPRPADSANVSRSAAVAPQIDELAGLRDQIEGLRQANERLEGRLAALQLGQGGARTSASAAETEELAALRNEMADLLFALRTPDAPPPDSLLSAVRRTLEDVRGEEERQRQLEREQERLQRIDRLATELELAPYQQADFRKAMVESEARREAAMALMRDGGDWGVARDAMRELREQSQATFSSILTPDQLERFGDLSNPRGGRGGGFGGANNNPGGGRRGGGGGGGGDAGQ